MITSIASRLAAGATALLCLLGFAPTKAGAHGKAPPLFIPAPPDAVYRSGRCVARDRTVPFWTRLHSSVGFGVRAEGGRDASRRAQFVMLARVGLHLAHFERYCGQRGGIFRAKHYRRFTLSLMTDFQAQPQNQRVGVLRPALRFSWSKLSTGLLGSKYFPDVDVYLDAGPTFLAPGYGLGVAFGVSLWSGLDLQVRYDAARELRLHAFVFSAGFTFPSTPYL